MSQVGDIIEGHLNELFKKQESLSERRLKICSVCPIARQTQIGLICDSSKWINKKGEVTNKPTPGYIRGCACRLSAKTRVDHAKCVIDKW